MNDLLRKLVDKLEQPAVRFTLVAIGFVILLKLRLILFAGALPVVAYWHYSNSSEDQDTGDQQQDQPDDSWQNEADDDDLYPMKLQGDGDVDPYEPSFWSGRAGPAPQRSGPSDGRHDGDEEDDDLFPRQNARLDGDVNGFPAGRAQRGLPVAFGGDDDDFLGFSGGKSGGGDSGGDFDFLGGLGDDLDFLGGRGKGKGKGCKGSKGDKGDKGGGMKGGEKGHEPNPKQVFVAGVGDMSEDEIRMFFEEIGEVERLKVLRQPDGQSKGVCFVTFRSEDQALKAIGLHGSDLGGKTLTVRHAHGGKGKEGAGKGDSFGGKGDQNFGGRGDRDFGGNNFSRAPSERTAPDLGGASRFGAVINEDRGSSFGGSFAGKGRGKGGNRRNERTELDELLEDALAESDGPLKAMDFDFAARRFLTEIRSRDRNDGTNRFQEAMDMLFKYTSSKDRASVRKWPAYIFTLLQKFDTSLWDELRERDAERKREKGPGRRGGDFEAPPEEEIIRAQRLAPGVDSQQATDRWGRPVFL